MLPHDIKALANLPLEQRSALPSPGQRVLIESVARLRLLDPRELGGLKTGGAGTEVHRVIQDTLRDLPRLSDAIAVSYFAHSTISRAGGGTAA